MSALDQMSREEVDDILSGMASDGIRVPPDYLRRLIAHMESECPGCGLPIHECNAKKRRTKTK
jgi:hypothetical protein